MRFFWSGAQVYNALHKGQRIIIAGLSGPPTEDACANTVSSFYQS